MLHGIFKEDKVHNSVDLIVRVKSFLQDFPERFPRLDSQVLGLSYARGKVAVDERVRVQTGFIHVLREMGHQSPS